MLDLDSASRLVKSVFATKRIYLSTIDFYLNKIENNLYWEYPSNLIVSRLLPIALCDRFHDRLHE